MSCMNVRVLQRIFINRNFALLWVGQIISMAGDNFFDTTLLLWVATQIGRGQSWTPLGVSAILLASSLPTVLIGPLAGVFVDRWDKRRTMLASDLIRAVLIFSLVPLGSLLIENGRLPTLWSLVILCLIAFLDSALTRFFIPSTFVLTGDIVKKDEQAQAMGMMQLVVRIPMLLGPPLAAILFFALGAQLALLFNAFSYLFSFLLVFLMRPPQSARSLKSGEKGQFFREFTGGFRFFFGNRVLTTVLIASCLVVLHNGAFSALGVFFLQQNLHAPLNLYGFLDTALAGGLILGSAVAAFVVQRLGLLRVLSVGLLLCGLLALIYSRLTNFVAALVTLFVLGIIIAGVNISTGPLVLQSTPKELTGRVSAILAPSLSLFYSLSLACVGYLDSTIMRNFHQTWLGVSFGPVDTIFLGAGILAIFGGVFAFVKLRGLALTSESPQQEHIQATAAGLEEEREQREIVLAADGEVFEISDNQA